MGITEQNIRDYVAITNVPIGGYASVWAVNMPSVGEFALFGAAATLFGMQYNILNVSDRGIMLIGVDGMGRLTPANLWFPAETIYGVKIKKGAMAYNVEIQVSGLTMKYRVNKFMVGVGFQKANIDRVIHMLDGFNRRANIQ